jgi:hypothetical protein
LRRRDEFAFGKSAVARLFGRLTPNRKPQFVLAAGALEDPDFGVVLCRLLSLKSHFGAADAAWELG